MRDLIGSNRVRFGPYEVDLHTHELWKHGTKLKLVGQPFEILAMLVSRPGELVTREELRTQLWPEDTFVDFNHGLNAAVNKLRDALCDSADDPKYIETLPRRGYRFMAAVEKIGIETAPEVGQRESAVPVNVATATSVLVPKVESTAVAPATGAGPDLCFGQVQERRPRGFKWWLKRFVWSGIALIVLGVIWHLGIAPFVQPSIEDQEKRAAEQRQRNRSGVGVPFADYSDPTMNPAFSPDGLRIAFKRESFLPGASGIYVKPVSEGEAVQLSAGEDDCCAAWAPDGKRLIFSRFSDGRREIMEVSEQGGTARALFSDRATKNGELDWSPDGATVALVGEGRPGFTSIWILSLETRTAHGVSMPLAGQSDWGPRYSPDGKQIVFVRSSGEGRDGEVLVMPSEGGETRRVATGASRIKGPPTWGPDGESIIFGGQVGDTEGLFRVRLEGGAPMPIGGIGGSLAYPAASKRGFLLAYEEQTVCRGTYQLDLNPPGQKPRPLIVTSSGDEVGAQYSPDGRRIVFGSKRLGVSDIWVSESNGKNPFQLTSVGTAGTPRWSPDGKSIAFDVGLGPSWQQPHAIFTVGSEGGPPHALAQDNHDNAAPSWSRSGAWVYFASDRAVPGEFQLWKVPAGGGDPVQITRQGGFSGFEGPNNTIYYAKTRYPVPEIWIVAPGPGGKEMPLYPPVRPLDWAAWTLTDKGILFATAGDNGRPALKFLDFAKSEITQLATLDRETFWVSATSDGKSVVFDQPGTLYTHIMLLQNFH